MLSFYGLDRLLIELKWYNQIRYTILESINLKQL